MIKLRFYAPAIAVVMLIVMLIFVTWQIRQQLFSRETTFAESSLHDVASRAQASLGRRYQEADMPGVRQVMAEVRIFRRETEAFLIGSDNRVLAADRLGVENLPISELPIAVEPAKLQQVRNSLQGIVAPDETNRSLMAYYPVSLARSSETPYSKTAVLVVNLHSAQGIAEVERVVADSMKQALAMVLGLVALLSSWFHLAITRRVNRLLDVSNRYALGELDARNPDPASDELGEIAAAFNHMADAAAEKQLSLAQSEARLRELNETLELRVAERTKALSHEVEERRRAEELMRDSQSELATILEVAPDGIIVITAQGIVKKFNRAAERMFGWTEAEIVGQKINNLMGEPHRADHDSYLERYRTTREARVIGQEREVDAQHRSGERFPIGLSVSEVQILGETHYVGVIRDIRERKAAQDAVTKAQQQVLETQKMAALGGLVAGIAHEINTPVGVGVTAVSHLREEVEDFAHRYRKGEMKRSDLDRLLDTSTESTQIIFHNLTRASELIRSFKEIAVDQTGDDVRDVNLEDYLGRVLTSLQPRLKNRPIRVTCTVDPADLTVRLQAGGISQIATNLVINSLTHGFANEDAGEIGFAVTRTGRGIVMVYHDTGKGMAPDVASRIFDPFFTTRRGQGGSGLGMHIVFNLVSQTYGGTITCESAPGEGTRFTITIPDCVIDTTSKASDQ